MYDFQAPINHPSSQYGVGYFGMCTFAQVAEEEGLITTPGELDVEPYFVDFLRDAPEMTGRHRRQIMFTTTRCNST